MSNEVVVRHPAGPVAIRWTEKDGGRLTALRLLSLDEALPPRRRDLPAWLQQLCDDMYEGRDITWASRHCDLSQLTPFRRKILSCLTESVPEGHVVSYRDLAKRSAAPKAARAIGGALAANPFPLIMPCHRVVTADGRMGGFMGDRSDRSGWKRRLLEREGHRLANGRLLPPADNTSTRR